jgi:hypothetical protein
MSFDASTFLERFPTKTPFGQWVRKTLGKPSSPAECLLLELGGGGGNMAQLLEQQGWKVTMLDADAQMVQRARENGVTALHMPAQEIALHFAPETFDAVISNAMFHWLEPQAIDSTLAGINYTLKPKGRFVAAFAGKHAHDYSLAALHKAAAKHGVDISVPWTLLDTQEVSSLLEKNDLEIEALASHVVTDRPFVGGAEGFYRAFAPSFGVPAEKLEAVIADALEILKDSPLYNPATDSFPHSDYVRIELSTRKQERRMEQDDIPSTSLAALAYTSSRQLNPEL